MASTLLQAAKRLVPIIADNVSQIDSERQLPPELAKSMADENLFGLYVPRSLGGPELDPINAFHVVEEISKIDGSAGWCCFNGSTITSGISRVSESAGKEIIGDSGILVGSGSARPEGISKITPGGFLISGRWNYLSGIDHSNVLFLNSFVVDENGPMTSDNGARLTRTVIVPVESGQVIDTWDTVGMRGTASNDAEFADLFVPIEHTYVRGDPSYHDNPLYSSQTAIHIGWTLAAANSLGMARGAMNCLVDMATSRGTANSRTLMRDRSVVQTVVGECEAIIDGARSFVIDAVGSMWDCQRTGNGDLEQRALRTRLAITHAIRQSSDAVDRLFHVAGVNAIHESLGLARFFRDLKVSVQHISGLENNYEFGGQMLMGAEITAPTYS